jgi:hypothetical protein
MSSMPTSSACDPRAEKESNQLVISKFEKFIKGREEETLEVKISCRPIESAEMHSMLNKLGKVALNGLFPIEASMLLNKIIGSILGNHNLDQHMVHFGLEFYWDDGSYAFTLERFDRGLSFNVKEAAPGSAFVPPCYLCFSLRVQLKTALEYLVEQSKFSYHKMTENSQHFCSHFWGKRYRLPPHFDEVKLRHNIREQYWQNEKKVKRI